MKFSIITPTFRRPELLTRTVNSLLSQTYSDWEMIIVNDSPKEEAYTSFASSINDPRIHYHVNLINKGVNFSRNYAIDHVSADSKWVIFLDDDDYLSPDTLTTLRNLILINPDKKWFVTNRALKNGTPLTKFPGDDTEYSYAWPYLITKRLKGDATHCIETKLVTHNHIRFSKYVKQGEEWFFFYHVGLFSKMYYHDHNSTISDGYSPDNGLNFRKRSFRDRYEAIAQLFFEGLKRKLFKPSFVTYIVLRLLALLIRR